MLNDLRIYVCVSGVYHPSVSQWIHTLISTYRGWEIDIKKKREKQTNKQRNKKREWEIDMKKVIKRQRKKERKKERKNGK